MERNTCTVNDQKDISHPGWYIIVRDAETNNNDE